MGMGRSVSCFKRSERSVLTRSLWSRFDTLAPLLAFRANPLEWPVDKNMWQYAREAAAWPTATPRVAAGRTIRGTVLQSTPGRAVNCWTASRTCCRAKGRISVLRTARLSAWSDRMEIPAIPEDFRSGELRRIW